MSACDYVRYYFYPEEIPLLNRLAAPAALFLILSGGSHFASAATISLALTADSGGVTDNASYWGGGGVTVTNINFNLSWSTDPAAYNCTNTATNSTCKLKFPNSTGMSAFFSGTANSTFQSFTTNSDASSSQNTNSPVGGSQIYVSQSGSGSYVDWYVVGSDILQAGHFYSSTAFSSNSVLDADYMASVIANITSNSWFISAPYNGSTYYPNGGDYFDSFGGLATATSGTPEPGTLFSLLGALGVAGALKLRRRN